MLLTKFMSTQENKIRRVYIIAMYSSYSYIINIFWGLLEILPNILRTVLFRLFFGRFGSGSWIDYGCFVRYPWRAFIGRNCAVNRGCEFFPSARTLEGSITLDDNVVLGPGVRIFAAGHDHRHLHLPDLSAPVRICSYAWIGGGSTILPGVTVGYGAVIGAGSVVASDVPPMTVAVGTPARVVKTRVILDHEDVKQ